MLSGRACPTSPPAPGRHVKKTLVTGCRLLRIFFIYKPGDLSWTRSWRPAIFVHLDGRFHRGQRTFNYIPKAEYTLKELSVHAMIAAII